MIYYYVAIMIYLTGQKMTPMWFNKLKSIITQYNNKIHFLDSLIKYYHK